MIVTVTLNPALDKTYSVADFALAGVFRVSKVQHLPSGKGLNVSRVLHTLGVPTMASGFLGGFTGKHIAQELDRLGIKHDFVWSNCESRQCIIVLNEEKGIHTELLEPGPFLAEEMFSHLEAKLDALAATTKWVSFSGSPPAGTPDDIFYHLIKQVKARGIKTVLDARGPWLQEGIKAGPEIIKPNWDEFQALGGPFSTTTAALWRAQEIVAGGVGLVLLSKGHEGAYAVSPAKVYFAQIPAVKIVSAVGSGDALVAGFLAGLEENWSVATCLKFANAVAISNACNVGAGVIDLEQVRKLGSLITITELKLSPQ